MESKYKKLAKNTAIFALGGFGSKVLTFLIVPLYTYVLTTEEYGKVDILMTTISLLIPFATLMVNEAMLRFVLGKELRAETAASNCWVVFSADVVLVLLLSPLTRLLFNSTQFAIVFDVLLILNSFTRIYGQFLRALGKNAAFAFNDILSTAVLLSSNLILLLGFKMGLKGYLISMVLSNSCSAVYIAVKIKLWNYISFKYVNWDSLKKMLKFSIPLIPNSLMWLVMSAGDKYIINYSLGDGANGIYSLAMKAPMVISMVYSLFFQAWQLSAIEENNDEKRKQFYENVFSVTTALLMMMTSGVILICKPVYSLIMSDSFSVAWRYIPILTIATIFDCTASFFSVIYTVSMRTSKVFYTTMLGAVSNIFFNILLVKAYGLQGTAIGTLLGFLLITLIRAKDTRKVIHMSFDLKRCLPAFMIVLEQCIVTLTVNNGFIYINGVVCLFLIMLIYIKEIKTILNTALKIVKKS